MIKLCMHYSIDTHSQNKIHGIWSITCLNRRLSVMRNFVWDLSCFLGSAGGKKYNWPVLYFFHRLSTVFETWQTIWSRPTVCRLSAYHWSTVGWHSANFYFWNESLKPDWLSADHRTTVGWVMAYNLYYRPIVGRQSPDLVPYKACPIFFIAFMYNYFWTLCFFLICSSFGGKRLNHDTNCQITTICKTRMDTEARVIL